MVGPVTKDGIRKGDCVDAETQKNKKKTGSVIFIALIVLFVLWIPFTIGRVLTSNAPLGPRIGGKLPNGTEVYFQARPGGFETDDRLTVVVPNKAPKHYWVDRLIWKEKDWIQYVSDERVRTYVLKKNEDMAGYFELIIHIDKKEVEIAYLGLLEEYQNKKLGSHLLSSAIKNSFECKPRRVWVHTCSLDHKNALTNYIARGMKNFKKETISI